MSFLLLQVLLGIAFGFLKLLAFDRTTGFLNSVGNFLE
jgi:hypothetical protein